MLTRRRQALDPGHRGRARPPRGPARVHGRGGQGRPPGPAAHHGRGGARLPRAPAHRDHRAAGLDRHLREPRAARPRGGRSRATASTLGRLAEMWATAREPARARHPAPAHAHGGLDLRGLPGGGVRLPAPRRLAGDARRRSPASRPTCSWPPRRSSSGAAGAGGSRDAGGDRDALRGAATRRCSRRSASRWRSGEPEGEVPAGTGAGAGQPGRAGFGPGRRGQGGSGDGAHRAPLGGAVGDAGRGRRPGAARRGARGLRRRRRLRRGSGGGFQHGPSRGPGGPLARRRSTGTAALVSLMEELEAMDWYQQRIEAAGDPELRGGARAQPRRGDRARRDEPRVAAPQGPGPRRAPAPVPLHHRLDRRDRGGRGGRRRRAPAAATAASASAACAGRPDEPPPSRARARHRRGLGARSTTRPAARCATS